MIFFINKMSEKSKKLKKELIKYSPIYGLIDINSKFWDDYEYMGEELLKYKIVKIKVYTGTYSEKQVILGFSCVFRNLINGEEIDELEHKGKEQYIDVKEFEIKNREYLTAFHIRYPNSTDYITEIGFETSNNRKFFVGTEEGENKIIEINGGNNVIIGTYGRIKRKLDAMGILTINKFELFKVRYFAYFILRYIIKKYNNFKNQWEEKYNELPYEYKYLWKAVNLPDAAFSQIISFLY